MVLDQIATRRHPEGFGAIRGALLMSIDHRGGLSRLLDGGSVVAHSERQLLDRFLASRDELAFEAIVAKHGPMVVGVCRSFLSNPTDVDDAFQATFLVLVKKAGSLRDGDQLSPWLHGVARRVSLQARTAATKRRDREPLAAGSEPTVPEATLRATEQRELAALIHAEVDRLSTPERSAITLCDLEGLTHQQAADQLGWPLGTVKARVSRGRDRLRNRLIRRGVTLPLGLLAASLASESSASIAVPTALLATTTRAALALAASRVLSVGLISAPVYALTQGAVRAMIFTKLKAGAIALAATASVLAVPGVVAYQGSAQPNPGVPSQAVTVPKFKKSTPVAPGRIGVGTAPQNTRLGLAEAAVQWIADHDRDGQPVSDDVRVPWFRRLAEVKMEIAESQADRVKAVESYVARIQESTTERLRGLMANMTSGGPGANGERWDEQWNNASKLTSTLDDAKRWLAQIKIGPVEAAPKNGPVAIKSMEGTITPSPGAGFGGGAFGGGGSEKPSDMEVERMRLKTSPSDDKQNQAILARLEERIAMNFPNDTPIADVIKYIEQCTIDKALGFPNGIPIYVDPQELQDADKTMASTIAINLEGLPLRVTLHLLLKQVNLTYVVEGGLLIIATPTSEIYPSNQPNRTKAPSTPARGRQ